MLSRGVWYRVVSHFLMTAKPSTLGSDALTPSMISTAGMPCRTNEY
jgi:hypothetical protein